MNLRGMFGSVARMVGGGAQAPAQTAGSYGGIGPGMDGAPLDEVQPQPARQPFMTPNRRENWTAKAFDVGSIMQGQDPNRMRELEATRETQRQQAEEQSRMEQLRGLAAEMFPDNPRAQLLFSLDPKAFGGALAGTLGRQTYKPGEVNVDGLTGGVVALPETMTLGDQFFNRNALTGAVDAVARRDETYDERLARELGVGNLNVARGNLAVRQQEAARSASGGGAGGGFWEPF